MLTRIQRAMHSVKTHTTWLFGHLFSTQTFAPLNNQGHFLVVFKCELRNHCWKGKLVIPSFLCRSALGVSEGSLYSSHLCWTEGLRKKDTFFCKAFHTWNHLHLLRIIILQQIAWEKLYPLCFLSTKTLLVTHDMHHCQQKNWNLFIHLVFCYPFDSLKPLSH